MYEYLFENFSIIDFHSVLLYTFDQIDKKLNEDYSCEGTLK